jgi:hypothetical protein
VDKKVIASVRKRREEEGRDMKRLFSTIEAIT